MGENDAVLSRFHGTLVDEIRAQRPDYLTGPFTVAEIYQNLVPYGTHRDLIGVEMNGDYEDALLRLLAGEGGFLVLDSEPALRSLREELETSNPNTGLYREYAAVDVRLNPDFVDGAPEPSIEEEPVDDLSGDEPEAEDAVSMEELAPPDEQDDTAGFFADDAPVEEEVAAEVGSSGEAAGACRWCRAALPDRENLHFCPFCGTDVNVVPCPGCGEELEPDWRFCVSCGTEVAS